MSASAAKLHTRAFFAQITGFVISSGAYLITAVRPIWLGIQPEKKQRIYFANHVSHGDFVLIWTVLPASWRKQTRPVAAADYWLKGPLRRFIGKHVFNAVLIDRDQSTRRDDPVQQMCQALDQGDSLILFPEGTRNTNAKQLLSFKSGIYHLHCQRPEIDLVPVWIANLNRVLPKGESVPVPLVCTVTFGTPVPLVENEAKDEFLDRARQLLENLSPQAQSSEDQSG